MPINKDELLALAKRVEALTGPDREVDALIHRALNPGQPIMTDGGGYGPKARPVQYTRLGDLEMNDWADAANVIGAPLITASIDSAMTLVPKGHTNPGDIVRAALKRLAEQFHLHAMHWPLVTPYPGYLARFVTAAALRAITSEHQPREADRDNG